MIIFHCFHDAMYIQVDVSGNGAPIPSPDDISAAAVTPAVVAAAGVSESQASMEILPEEMALDGIQLQPTKGPLGLFVRVRIRNILHHINHDA